MKKILLAIDSYKGCLSSKEVETCVEQALHARFPDCKTRCFPIADGGEGLLDALTSVTDMQIIQTEVHNPLMRIRNARYGILKDKLTAIIRHATAGRLTVASLTEVFHLRQGDAVDDIFAVSDKLIQRAALSAHAIKQPIQWPTAQAISIAHQ